MSASPSPRPYAPSRETVLRFGAFLAVSVFAEAWIYRAVVAKVGAPSVPLDDVFIHFQYARTIAELRPFRYGSPLDTPSSGATSLLYPLLLAVPYALGMRAFRLILAAHAVGAVGWALAAEGFHRIGRALVGRTFGVVTSVIPFACAGLVWAAGSGMETILAVAAVALTLGFTFDLDTWRAPRHAVALAVTSAVAPLLRPEFMAISLGGALALAWRAPRGHRRWALLPLLATPFVPVFWRWMTGEWRTTGAQAKLLALEPYRKRSEILPEWLGHVRATFGDVLAGKDWAERYFPEHFDVLAELGAVLGLLRLAIARRPLSAVAWAGALALPVPVGLFGVWNLHRFRYLWPGFTAWLVAGLFAVWTLAWVVGSVLARLARDRSMRDPVAALGVGALLGAFALRVPAAVQDLADCGRAIRGQQVTAALTHVRRLPADAPVLLNDAGAIAYLGEHRTVDFLGLTNLHFALAWHHGAGSTFEQLEDLAPDARPRFAAVYRGWLGGDDYLGPDIATVFVAEQSILGSGAKNIARVRHELFGTGEAPIGGVAPGIRVADALDVALVEDERRHAMQQTPWRRDQNLLRVYLVDGRSVADGGRVVETEMRFVLRATAGTTARLLLRTDAWFDGGVEITWNGQRLGEIAVQNRHSFVDLPIDVPAARVLSENHVLARPARMPNFAAFHWFLLQPGSAAHDPSSPREEHGS